MWGVEKPLRSAVLKTGERLHHLGQHESPEDAVVG